MTCWRTILNVQIFRHRTNPKVFHLSDSLAVNNRFHQRNTNREFCHPREDDVIRRGLWQWWSCKFCTGFSNWLFSFWHDEVWFARGCLFWLDWLPFAPSDPNFLARFSKRAKCNFYITYSVSVISDPWATNISACAILKPGFCSTLLRYK